MGRKGYLAPNPIAKPSKALPRRLSYHTSFSRSSTRALLTVASSAGDSSSISSARFTRVVGGADFSSALAASTWAFATANNSVVSFCYTPHQTSWAEQRRRTGTYINFDGIEYWFPVFSISLFNRTFCPNKKLLRNDVRHSRTCTRNTLIINNAPLLFSPPPTRRPRFRRRCPGSSCCRLLLRRSTPSRTS